MSDIQQVLGFSEIKDSNELLSINLERGKLVAKKLHDTFSSVGVLGHTEMPEDIFPSEIQLGSIDHMMFITLTVSIDYQRDAVALWQAARKTYSDPDLRYLFIPAELAEKHMAEIINDMRRYSLSKKYEKDAAIWRTVALAFHKKWNGNPWYFLESCEWDAPRILERLKSDLHEDEGRYKKDFPYLGGDKIGPLWLRMLRDNLNETRLLRLDRIPIPVDVHVARATFALGLVTGNYIGRMSRAYEEVRRAWAESVKGLRTKTRDMIPLDLDEPLWNLSKYGCTKRNSQGLCPMRDSCELHHFCVSGKISVRKDKIELGTRSAKSQMEILG